MYLYARFWLYQSSLRPNSYITGKGGLIINHHGWGTRGENRAIGEGGGPLYFMTTEMGGYHLL